MLSIPARVALIVFLLIVLVLTVSTPAIAGGRNDATGERTTLPQLDHERTMCLMAGATAQQPSRTVDAVLSTYRRDRYVQMTPAPSVCLKPVSAWSAPSSSPSPLLH